MSSRGAYDRSSRYGRKLFSAKKKGKLRFAQSALLKDIDVNGKNTLNLAMLGMVYLKQYNFDAANEQFVELLVFFDHWKGVDLTVASLFLAGTAGLAYAHFTNFVAAQCFEADNGQLLRDIAIVVSDWRDAGIFDQLARACIRLKRGKGVAIELSTLAVEKDLNCISLHTHVVASLWNNQFEGACSAMERLLLEFLDHFDKRDKELLLLFRMFLSKGQFNLVEQWLGQQLLKERFKPLYYALMTMMRDQYPSEILRMGPELKETVDEVLADIEKLAEQYK